MADYARVHGWVSGNVQGVGFRYFVQDVAGQYKLAGWVRNLPDGRVEFEAEGTKGMLNEFLREINRGPILGYVSKLEVKWDKFSGEFNGFRIRF